MITGTKDSCIAWRDAATDEIKQRISVREVMEQLGWRVSRNRKRSDCGLCGGKEDVAITRELWNCHRCHAAGDIFNLVMAVHGVEFPDALKFLAREANVELPNRVKMPVQEQQRFDREREARQARQQAKEDEYVAVLRVLLREMETYEAIRDRAFRARDDRLQALAEEAIVCAGGDFVLLKAGLL